MIFFLLLTHPLGALVLSSFGFVPNPMPVFRFRCQVAYICTQYRRLCMRYSRKAEQQAAEVLLTEQIMLL